MDTSFNLRQYEITVAEIHHNLPASKLYEHAIRYEVDASIAENGALVAYSGAKTGRSPKDKRVVKHVNSQDDIWWGPVNIPLDEHSFAVNRERSRDYLNTRERLYCFDGFAGWDPKYRIKVRVICSRPYHALFMHTMLIRPTKQELAEFGEPDFVICNAGAFPANRLTTGVESKTSICLSLEDRELIILGTEYAGEMKKGVFTVANYFAPKRGLLSMHCSATADPDSGRSSLLFGLSGTGKTTLSADPKRSLIGDDEHVWSDDGIFNIEGGCYAKAINLSPETEPDIFQALRFGAVLENVVLEEDHSVDFTNTSITENTRGAYPINFIRNARIPCMAGHPTDVIFLTCDAFGVLPPVSSLSPAQAMYHFISGYTAKVAGTEVGVKEPSATFSPCFGGPFLVWHPNKYAELLATKMRQHNSRVWLINTGWSGGPHGVGKRIKLAHTRGILDAIHSGALASAKTKPDPLFGFDVVVACPGVPAEILWPRDTWADKSAYDVGAKHLAKLFTDNFKKYESGASAEVRRGLTGAVTPEVQLGITMESAELWQRYQQFLCRIPALELSLDVSRMRFADNFLNQMAPAMRKSLEAMDALERGAIANPDENRMVGHYWLRAPDRAPSPEIKAQILQTVENIKAFAAQVHRGDILPMSAARFTRVLSIGIGGSALGPMFVADALGNPTSDKMRIDFIDNTDPNGIARSLGSLAGRLGETLCIVASKSGGTPETRNGMLLVADAYQQANLNFPRHAVAITMPGSKIDQIATEQGWLARFPMFDWIGGRTSVLSAVGLLPAALQGLDIDGLLSGAAACDEATRRSDLQNPAALMALMWYHATDGQGKKDMVVLPYKDRLLLFSRYLQQLIMESLGKQLDLLGRRVDQGLAVYGNKGSTDQHAYVQQLREGVPNFFAVFIRVLESGGSALEVEHEVTAGDYLHGFLLGTRTALFENDRESMTITIPRVDARVVGGLIALFERAVGLYANLIGVNAYHQPGVEAGKTAAATVLALQRKVLGALTAAPQTADQIAAGAGAEDEAETVYLLLEHLAANGRARIAHSDKLFRQTTFART